MQEDGEGEEWTNVFHGQHKDVDKVYIRRSPVSDFIVYHFVIHIPTDKQTGEKGADGQTAVCREPVEEIKERHTKQCTPIPHSQ